MSPSKWHEDARDRDAGHDEMQLAVLERFRASRDCWPEMPIIDRRNRVLAFADIAVCQVDDTGRKSWAFIELKPRIHSCGALIRQCKAIEMAAKRAGIGDCRVTACVYDDDPKLELLRSLYDDVLALPRATERRAAA